MAPPYSPSIAGAVGRAMPADRSSVGVSMVRMAHPTVELDPQSFFTVTAAPSRNPASGSSTTRSPG